MESKIDERRAQKVLWNGQHHVADHKNIRWDFKHRSCQGAGQPFIMILWSSLFLFNISFFQLFCGAVLMASSLSCSSNISINSGPVDGRVVDAR